MPYEGDSQPPEHPAKSPRKEPAPKQRESVDIPVTLPKVMGDNESNGSKPSHLQHCCCLVRTNGNQFGVVCPSCKVYIPLCAACQKNVLLVVNSCGDVHTAP